MGSLLKETKSLIIKYQWDISSSRVYQSSANEHDASSINGNSMMHLKTILEKIFLVVLGCAAGLAMVFYIKYSPDFLFTGEELFYPVAATLSVLFTETLACIANIYPKINFRILWAIWGLCVSYLYTPMLLILGYILNQQAPWLGTTVSELPKLVGIIIAILLPAVLAHLATYLLFVLASKAYKLSKP